MVQIWSMLATRNVVLAAHALDALPVEPSTATWITYIRCHDDIGWAIGDADADAVGLNGYWHRVFLADWYRGSYPMSDARGLRGSGSAWSARATWPGLGQERRSGHSGCLPLFRR